MMESIDTLATFDIDPAHYFELVLPAMSPNGRSVAQNIAATEASICEMAARYGLASKSVLSLGPRFGHDEYWLWHMGCPLVLIDIDEAQDIFPYLCRCRTGKNFRFVIGDAFTWSKGSSETFDVLYTSGFGPQEIRRAKLLEKGPWLVGTPFYDSIVLDMCRKHLRPGGLFINLSYYAGPSLNEAIIESMSRQLASVGLRLAEVHALRSAPGIHLDVAVHNDDAFAERLARMPSMATIHGRAELEDSTVIRMFPHRESPLP